MESKVKMDMNGSTTRGGKKLLTLEILYQKQNELNLFALTRNIIKVEV